MPHPGDSSGTTQIPQPILPAGYRGGDDGGFDGGHGNGGGGRGKLWILAVLAVIAIAAGVALALTRTPAEDGGGKGTDALADARRRHKETEPTASAERRDERRRRRRRPRTASSAIPRPADYTPLVHPVAHAVVDRRRSDPSDEPSKPDDVHGADGRPDDRRESDESTR